MKKTLIVISAVTVLTGAGFAADAWTAPARAAAKKNAIPSDPVSIGRGKTVYAGECASCHGSSGRGDGPAAKDLEKHPGDMTKLGGQSDGALFWKITEGKKPMASFATKLSEQQRWDVINYMKTLK